jgi:hypothetical protein
MNQVLLIRAGRGNSGGTTAIDATIQLAHRNGRKPVILDAARNPSLSALYPEAVRPETHAIGDVKEAITRQVLDRMLEENCSGVIDLGGGQDDTLVDYTMDLDIVAFGQSVGIQPVFLVTFGPQMDDFDHALEVKRRGLFDGAGVLLVQNEGVLRRGQNPGKVFGEIAKRPEFIEWVQEGARPLYLKTFAWLERTRSLGLSLLETADNKRSAKGDSVGMATAWACKDWLNSWEKQFVQNDCQEWML